MTRRSSIAPPLLRRTLLAATAFLAGAGLAVGSAAAAEPTPVGFWKTIDDDGKTAKSIVEIYERGGKLFGKIVRLIDPEEPNPLCDKCKGERYNKPVIGMEIMWELERDDDEWSEGRILDPDNGEDYLRIRQRLLASAN